MEQVYRNRYVCSDSVRSRSAAGTHWDMLTRPTPAMAVAGTALLISLGGTGYAATQLPPKSVGRAQLRNGAVGNLQIRDRAITTGKLRDGAITTAKIRDGVVGAKDLAKGVVPVAQAALQQTSGEAVAPGAIGGVSAQCPAGAHATGGGGGFVGPADVNDRVVDSIPVGDERPPLRWRVTLYNGAAAARTPVAYVICTT